MPPQQTHLNKSIPEVRRWSACLWWSRREAEALRLHHPASTHLTVRILKDSCCSLSMSVFLQRVWMRLDSTVSMSQWSIISHFYLLWFKQILKTWACVLILRYVGYLWVTNMFLCTCVLTLSTGCLRPHKACVPPAAQCSSGRLCWGQGCCSFGSLTFDLQSRIPRRTSSSSCHGSLLREKERFSLFCLWTPQYILPPFHFFFSLVFTVWMCVYFCVYNLYFIFSHYDFLCYYPWDN